MNRRTRAVVSSMVLASALCVASCGDSGFPVTPTPVANANVTTLSGGTWAGTVLLADGTTTSYNMTLVARGLGATTAVRPLAQTAGSVEVSGLFETGTQVRGTVAGTLEGTMQHGSFHGTLTSDSPSCSRVYRGPITETSVAWLAEGEAMPPCPLTFALRLGRERGLACEYAISLSRHSFPDAGGTGEATVRTGPTCVWIADSGAEWIELSDRNPKVGPGTITFTVAPNQHGDRKGELRIANSSETVTIEQGRACTVAVSPSRVAVGRDGGSSPLTVSAPDGCRWSAQTAAGWLAVTPREGTGSAVLTVTAQPNAGVTREGALTVGGETVAVSQTAACELVVSPTASRFGSAASEGTITVSTQPGCAWTAASDAGWITLSPRAGDGNSVINYSVAANGGRTFREGTISVAGRLVRISQEGLACDYQLGPVGVGQLFFGQQGGSATIGVLAQSDCEWTVTADPAAPWITIPPPTNHRGNGSFSYTVDALDPNDQDIRTGDITVNAGATSPLRVTITQLRSGPVVEVGAVAGSSSRRR